MTLAFSTKIEGKPTYFVGKIWKSIIDSQETTPSLILAVVLLAKHAVRAHNNNIKFIEKKEWSQSGITPKIHTIRKDKSNRWEKGRDIHFVINNRTKDRFQFAPVIKCTHIDLITIEYKKEFMFPFIWIREPGQKNGGLRLDPREHFIYISELSELALNDGFENWEAFLRYFNEDFEGKIIHWTKFNYLG